MVKSLIITFFLALVINMTNVGAQSNIWYVNSTATGFNLGTSWNDAFVDLKIALSYAASGDAIWVAEGVYVPDAGTDKNQAFILKSGVKIYGGFKGWETSLNQRDPQSSKTTLSGNIGNPQDSTDNSYTILYMAYPDSSTLIDGFVFRHGYAKSDTSFLNNSATLSGGAVYIQAKNGKALPVFRNCIFRDNVAKSKGGALYVNALGTTGCMPLFYNCKFINNKALSQGGAIYWTGGNSYDRGIEFDHCVFDRNTASIQSGGIYFENSFFAGTLDFYKCTISNNSTFQYGGFMNMLKSGAHPLRVNIDDCNIYNNYSEIGESVLHIEDTGSAPTKQVVFKLTKSIFANNNQGVSINGDLGAIILYPISSGPSSILDSIVISQNIIHDNRSGLGTIITLGCNGYFSVDKNIIYSNTALSYQNSNGPSPAIGISGRKIRVYDNVFYNNLSSALGVGITPDSNSELLVFNNLFFNNRNIYSSFGGRVLSTFMQPNTGYLDTAEIFNNVFVNNVVSVNDNLENFPGYAPARYRNNIIVNNTDVATGAHIPPFRLNWDSLYLDNNLVDFDCSSLAKRLVCGSGNIFSTETVFVDTATHDFHLQSCSPAIDMGYSTLMQEFGITNDFEGSPRIIGSSIDIGAYESPAFALATTPQIQPACTNSPGGAISLSTANGCEPFSYTWSPPAGNGASISDLPPGDYHFTVTDNRGRQITSLATVPAAPSPVLTPAIQDLQCGFITGGSITANVNSGTAPYSFVWENGATGIQRDMLPAGQYQVTITDASGCQDSAQIHIQQSGQITLQVDGQPISCFGAADAQLSATAATGKAPFSYQWSQGATDSLLSPLGPGQYTVTVSDAYGCTATFTFNLSDPPPLQAAAIAQPTNNLQNPSGSVTAIPSGGTPTHTYVWSNGGLTQTINNLPPGVYTVTVTDAHGCSATATAEVKLVISTGEAPGLAVQVWPNPMRERLDIEALQLPAGTYRFVLRDVLGREVAAAAVAGGRAVLATGDLPAGAYLWYLETEDGVVVSGKVLR